MQFFFGSRIRNSIPNQGRIIHSSRSNIYCACVCKHRPTREFFFGCGQCVAFPDYHIYARTYLTPFIFILVLICFATSVAIHAVSLLWLRKDNPTSTLLKTFSLLLEQRLIHSTIYVSISSRYIATILFDCLK